MPPTARRTAPRFLLAYPPLAFTDDELVRPDGTLGLAYLHAALAAAGVDVRIVDMAVGTDADDLDATFLTPTRLANGRARVGLPPDRILEEVADVDVVGIGSIFTQQTGQVLDLLALLRRERPDLRVVLGGVNARAHADLFLDAGADVIFLGEAEEAIVAYARHLETGRPALEAIDGVAYRRGERTVVQPARGAVTDLDRLPMPSWEAMPLERYWRIGRVWGGRDGWLAPDEPVRYAAMLTSRGCPFRCSYCHISKERGGLAGDIGGLRLHSVGRVRAELDRLESLGVRQIFVNDDSFLARRGRVLTILEDLARRSFRLADVNGVNIVHFFRREGARLVVDEGLVEALAAAGFRKLSLPFESGSQRLIDKYSTGKWSLERCDVGALIRTLRRHGIAADGNFTIGYPDETPEELMQTYLLAKRAMDEGLIGVGFFHIQPFPGTALFDDALASGQLAEDWHWDDLGWSKGTPFTRPATSPEILKYTWELVWKLLNKRSRVDEMSRQKPLRERSADPAAPDRPAESGPIVQPPPAPVAAAPQGDLTTPAHELTQTRPATVARARSAVRGEAS